MTAYFDTIFSALEDVKHQILPRDRSQESNTSRTGHRLDASRNLWDRSGLKVNSALTNVGCAGGSTFRLLSTIASPLHSLFSPNPSLIPTHLYSIFQQNIKKRPEWRTRHVGCRIVESRSVIVFSPNLFPFPFVCFPFSHLALDGLPPVMFNNHYSLHIHTHPPHEA